MAKSNAVWVLTREHNDYDQYGEYFECVFKNKPSLEDLSGYFSSGDFTGSFSHYDIMGAIKFLENLRNGGGRMEKEDVWYNLTEIELK